MEEDKYNLFKYMAEQHGITLLEDELSEITSLAAKDLREQLQAERSKNARLVQGLNNLTVLSQVVDDLIPRCKIGDDIEFSKIVHIVKAHEVKQLLTDHPDTTKADPDTTKFHCTKHPDCGCGVEHCKEDQGEAECELCEGDGYTDTGCDENGFSWTYDCPKCSKTK